MVMTYFGVFLEKVMKESSIPVDVRRLPRACARERRSLAGSFTFRLAEMRWEIDLRENTESFSTSSSARSSRNEVSGISAVSAGTPAAVRVPMSESSKDEYRVAEMPSSVGLLSAGPQYVADLENFLAAISASCVRACTVQQTTPIILVCNNF